MAPTATSQWQEISGLLHAKCATTILVYSTHAVAHILHSKVCYKF